MAVARGTVPIIPHSPITKSRGLQVITIDQCRVHTHSVGLEHWSARPSLQGRWCVCRRGETIEIHKQRRAERQIHGRDRQRKGSFMLTAAERITAVTLRVYLKCNIMSLKKAGIVKDETSCSEASHPVTSHRKRWSWTPSSRFRALWAPPPSWAMSALNWLHFGWL